MKLFSGRKSQEEFPDDEMQQEEGRSADQLQLPEPKKSGCGFKLTLILAAIIAVVVGAGVLLQVVGWIGIGGSSPAISVHENACVFTDLTAAQNVQYESSKSEFKVWHASGPNQCAQFGTTHYFGGQLYTAYRNGQVQLVQVQGYPGIYQLNGVDRNAYVVLPPEAAPVAGSGGGQVMQQPGLGGNAVEGVENFLSDIGGFPWLFFLIFLIVIAPLSALVWYWEVTFGLVVEKHEFFIEVHFQRPQVTKEVQEVLKDELGREIVENVMIAPYGGTVVTALHLRRAPDASGIVAFLQYRNWGKIFDLFEDPIESLVQLAAANTEPGKYRNLLGDDFSAQLERHKSVQDVARRTGTVVVFSRPKSIDLDGDTRQVLAVADRAAQRRIELIKDAEVMSAHPGALFAALARSLGQWGDAQIVRATALSEDVADRTRGEMN